ncbi:hypothetical protein LOTGIDRAFT_237655 [Lottia gigantea]|uniref:Uncharacterized protein n=1 Tax=Lottia gigantea TaxID=225164 RepID=V4B0F9_LOTGI|nr:hypothetical protein LOTGIDRAFT_237655 [Lottia gigantea]ESP03543.1 hypothetical protein LOTGIDRAFT_237655 [Lottia gigantea]
MKLIILAACVCLAVSAPTVQERGLLDSLTGLTDGTKLGSAMKVLDAFSKVSTLISDLKNIAPEAHKALSGSIDEIKNSMGSIVTGITSALEGQTKSVKTRGLLDSLTGLTDGTKLGSAMKVLDAFSKVSTLISDLKNIAPEAHKALSGSIDEIKNSMGSIVTGITSALEGQTKSVKTRGLLDSLTGLTDGTKLGSAMKVLDAFSKVSTLISDLKNIAPEAHKALSGSIDEIKNSMGSIVTGITSALEGQTKSVKTRGLLDSLTGLTDGTKLGSAMKVLDAFSKVSTLISDLKNIAPEAHKALSGSIDEIKNSMGSIVTDITKAIKPSQQ